MDSQELVRHHLTSRLRFAFSVIAYIASTITCMNRFQGGRMTDRGQFILWRGGRLHLKVEGILRQN